MCFSLVQLILISSNINFKGFDNLGMVNNKLIIVTWSEGAGSRSLTGVDYHIKLRVSFDLIIRACQLYMIRHFGSSYKYNNIYIYNA